MVVAYVRFVANIDDEHAPRSCVHAMLLPKADDESGWGEIAVTPSTLHGVGVFPSGAQHTVWDNVHSVPVALPYFGHESVCEDRLSHRCLVNVLKGNFETLVVHDQQRLHNREYVADELFAVPKNGEMADAKSLPADTPLLQIEDEPGVRPSAQVDTARTRDLPRWLAAAAQLSWVRAAHGRYYLLADRVSDMLQVTFEPGKSAATHLAEVYHKEEGYVLVNGHPKFANPLAVGACINEPPPDVRNNMRIVNEYAELVEAGDPELRLLSVVQSAAALAA
jgi:hypothetical protein